MREALLLASILLGQLAPNAHFLTQLENKLRLEPKAVTTIEGSNVVAPIIAQPTRLNLVEQRADSAQAVYSIDLASNATLTDKDMNKRLQVASLTKLMTAYVILKEEQSLSRVVSVGNLTPQLDDSTMGLVPGDQMTIRSLLDGLLIPSGSDAAQTLAEGNSGTMTAFVAKMNKSAAALNLENTHFANPVGWDDANNYSSARDLTELTRILLRNDTFKEIVQTRNKTVYTTSGRGLTLASTNQLLYNPGYLGVKTGFTYGAGECLISLYKDGESEILTTVIGSTNRFQETESIKGWILDHFSWYNDTSLR